mgnify:CR=1 FL=1
MIISAVIPTKNRPHDLLQAVRSILSQKRLPDQLIIIDQSNDNGKLINEVKFKRRIMGLTSYFKKLWEKNTILKQEFHTSIPLLILKGK